jgi:hypothetical protein
MLHDNRAAILLGWKKDTTVDIIRFSQNGDTYHIPNIMRPAASNTAEPTKLVEEGAIPADTWREALTKQNKPRPRGLCTMYSPVESGSRTTSLGSFHDKDAPVWTDGATDEDERGIWAWLEACWHTLMYPLLLIVDIFGNNAYRLHGCFYLLLALFLAVTFLLASIFHLADPPKTKREGWKELLIDYPLLSIMVQFALFLFPPLFVRPLRL